jgi:hypothetical protein
LATITRCPRLTTAFTSAGGTLRDIDERDWQDLPDLGPGFTVDATWQHESARVASEPS